jgi:hypothetical protein
MEKFQIIAFSPVAIGVLARFALSISLFAVRFLGHFRAKITISWNGSPSRLIGSSENITVSFFRFKKDD